MIIDTKSLYQTIKTELLKKEKPKGKVAIVTANDKPEIKKYIDKKYGGANTYVLTA